MTKRLAKGQLIWYKDHHPDALVPARYGGPEPWGERGTGGHLIFIIDHPPGSGAKTRVVYRDEIVTKEERDLEVTKEVLDS